MIFGDLAYLATLPAILPLAAIVPTVSSQPAYISANELGYMNK
jgi:hypothetical protein